MVTVQDVLNEYRHYPKDAEVCPYCYRLLLTVNDEEHRVRYCPNDMCLNDEQEQFD